MVVFAFAVVIVGFVHRSIIVSAPARFRPRRGFLSRRSFPGFQAGSLDHEAASFQLAEDRARRHQLERLVLAEPKIAMQVGKRQRLAQTGNACGHRGRLFRVLHVETEPGPHVVLDDMKFLIEHIADHPAIPVESFIKLVVENDSP